MTPDELRHLIVQDENPKLEFKSKFYELDHLNKRVQEIHSDELIKDILALTNGNAGRTDEDGYLIIGVDNKFNTDGTRNLYDVGTLTIDRNQIIGKINSACHPPLQDIKCKKVMLNGQDIWVIIIPRSPFLHMTTRELGEHKEYPKNTVFVRRGEAIGTATPEEIQKITLAKERYASTNKPLVISAETRSLDFITDPAILDAKLYAEENDNNPLSHHNISYQQRDPERDIQRELRSALNTTRYLLITAPTGVGKTREAAELAQTLMHEGYRVVRVKRGILEVPTEFPTELGNNPRRILIFLDDLNFLFRNANPIAPPQTDDTLLTLLKAEERNFPLISNEPITLSHTSNVLPKSAPYHDRLLVLLNTFEKWCGENELRIIATARDEPEMWRDLDFNPHDPLWKRFVRFELPLPRDSAIVKLLEDSTVRANLEAEPKDFFAIARRGDGKFSTIVENLRDVQRENKTVALDNFAGTLDNLWRDQYEQILHRHAAIRYIYDAIDLLVQTGIELYPWIVEPTACLVWDGDQTSRSHQHQIKRALKYLVSDAKILAEAEGKFTPRERQIEAKGTRIDLNLFVSSLQNLLFRLITNQREGVLNAIHRLASKLYESNQFDQAILLWQKGLELAPDSSAFLNGLGLALMSLKQYTEAEKVFRQAADMNTNDALALSNLGKLMQELDRYDDAEDAYRRAIKLDPESYDTYMGLAQVLTSRGRSSEAIDLCKWMLNETWRGLELEFRYGAALLGIGDIEGARDQFRQVIQDWGEDSGALLFLGLTSQRLGDFYEAEDALRRCIKSDPTDWSTYIFLFGLLNRFGRLDEAIEVLQDAIAHNPNEESTIDFNKLLQSMADLKRVFDALLHSIYYNSGDALAYSILDNSNRSEPEVEFDLKQNDTGPYSEILHILHDRNPKLERVLRIQLRLPDALPFLEEYARDVPRDYYSRLAVASIYKLASDNEKSEVYADEARLLIPTGDWYSLARLESICGNTDTALEHLLRASEEPNFDPKMARYELDFVLIRSDPRFDEIVVVPPAD